MKSLKMKCVCLLALAMTLLAASVLAAGNVNIAIRGRDDFNDSIRTMFASRDQLIMVGHNAMYMWSKETGLVHVEGYEDLGSLYTETVTEDGRRYVTIGEEKMALEDENASFSVVDTMYAVDGSLYTLAGIRGEEGYETMMLVELLIGDDGRMSAGRVIDIGDALLVDYGGYYDYNGLQNVFEMDGVLYGLTYVDDILMLAALDTLDGDCDLIPLDIDGGIQSMAKFDETRALLVVYDDAATCKLQLLDVKTEKMTELGTLPRINGESPTALCYDSERGKLYYVQDGTVWRMDITEDGIGEAEAFADMPLQINGDVACVLLGDTYILSTYDGVVGRDVTVEKLPPERLVIENGAYIEHIRDAYYDFAEEYPAYTVSIRDAGFRSDALVQAMMSRSSDVDIYTLSSDDAAFLTLLSRGYMAGLGRSEKLTALVGSMYPVLQAFVTQGGELYAVPLDLYVSGEMSYNRTVLVEKLGYSEDELPTSWEGLFALIAELAATGRMQDVPEASLLGPYTTERGAKGELFQKTMDAYFLWLDADPANLEHGSEVLLRLCDAFEQVDWSNLHFIAEEDRPEGYNWSEDDVILHTYGSIMPGDDPDASQIVPVMSLFDGAEPMLGARVELAFVSPFSKHREAAIAYLEKTAALIETRTLMNMCPDMNDPIENSRYEENLKSYDETIAKIEENIAKAEKAEDDETIATLTENLEEVKQEREAYETEGRWQISPEEIERYREAAKYLQVTRERLWNDADSSSRVQQYLDGAIDKEQLVRELERTIQMQRQEGM